MKASKVEETSRAASIIGCSNDLLTEILSYLPARTLLRFKLVSKQWKWIISDRQFAIKHSRNTHSRAPCGLFLYLNPRNRRIKTVSIPLFGNPPGSVPPLSFRNQLPRKLAYSYADIQSCNGLLLCLFSKIYRQLDAESHCVVRNPTTRDFKVLPTPPDLGTNDWLDGLTLVFNPLESHHYKVVGIKRYRLERGACELHIYSSETNCWKFCRLIDLDARRHKGVFSNGTVYWIGRNHMHYYNVNSGDVGSLDMPVVPSMERINWSSSYFVESCGHLYLATPLRTFWHHEYNIFEFDNCSLKWSDPNKEIFVSDCFESNRKPKYTSLLAVAKGENDMDFVLLFATCSRLITSNLVLHRQVEAHGTPKLFESKACEYIQSLAPV